MKYYVRFPDTAGQYAGTHWFSSVTSRAAFIKRAIARRIDLSATVIGKI